jgi:hypothetical protein
MRRSVCSAGVPAFDDARRHDFRSSFRIPRKRPHNFGVEADESPSQERETFDIAWPRRLLDARWVGLGLPNLASRGIGGWPDPQLAAAAKTRVRTSLSAALAHATASEFGGSRVDEAVHSLGVAKLMSE